MKMRFVVYIGIIVAIFIILPPVFASELHQAATLPGQCSISTFSLTTTKISSTIYRVDLRSPHASCTTSSWPTITASPAVSDYDQVSPGFPLASVATSPATFHLAGPAHLYFYLAAPSSSCQLRRVFQVSLTNSTDKASITSPLHLCHPLVEVSPLQRAAT